MILAFIWAWAAVGGLGFAVAWARASAARDELQEQLDGMQHELWSVNESLAVYQARHTPPPTKVATKAAVPTKAPKKQKAKK